MLTPAGLFFFQIVMKNTRQLKLTPLKDEFAICQLDQGSEIPSWAFGGEFCSLTRTSEELSILCPANQVPEMSNYEPGWRGLKIEGPFEFDEIGVLASLTAPLAEAKISLLTVSTYDTDYIFIQQKNYRQAVNILEAAGHTIT
jgi:hypothetical protein